MISRLTVGVVCISLLGATAVAEGKAAKPAKPSGTPIDGVWRAKGTVIVARHISDASVGQKFTRTWTIKSTCSAACKTTLSYGTSSGHQIRVPLEGKGKTWKGSIDNQVFPCTNGATATGSLSFKLHVTGLAKKKKQRVASGMTAIASQQGTGCAVVKEVVKFTLSRA